MKRRGEGERCGHNLPHLASSFVGRQEEIAEVSALLTAARVVTLTGVGGMGKTRLALEVARGAVSEFPDGVWLIELAQLTDPALLPEAFAAGFPDPVGLPTRHAAEDLVRHIGNRTILLVLDNCEHVLEPCGRLADALLRACPGLSVLATSRAPLAIAGEHRWPIGPLSLPDPGVGEAAAAVEASGAGQLFLQRAAASRPGFRLTEAVAPAVAQICHRLDGMPLAMELAAARLASLSPFDVLERLDDRFHLLTTRSATVEPRHQTLSATLEWSHDLLSPAEAMLLRRVSVFSDWSLEAAQQVCGGDGLEQREVVDRLDALVAKSLVVVIAVDDGVRYSLLETVRAWAREKLDGAPEAEAVARRHALWCLRLAEKADDEQGGSRPPVWLDRLEAEHDSLRAALGWARATGDARFGVRLATALASFWRTRGHLQEGMVWLEWALTHREDCPLLLQARLLRETGLFRGMLGDTGSALPLLEESSELFAQSGDHDASLCACNSLLHMFRDPRRSLPGLEADVESCRETGDTNKLAHFLSACGQAHFLLGDLSAARLHFEECVQLGRGCSDGEALRSGLFGLGRVAVLVGEPEVAESLFEEAHVQAQAMADVDHVVTAMVLLSDLARARGDWQRTTRLLEESSRITNPDGSPVDQARTFYFLARLAEARGDVNPPGAGELFRSALSLGRVTGAPGFHEVRSLLGIGLASQVSGNRSAAAGGFLEALATAQALGDAHATAQALDRLGRLARDEGKPDEAETLAYRGLELHASVGDVAGTASSLDSVAGVAVDAGRWAMAARLLALSQTMLDRAGYVRCQADQVSQEGDLGLVRSALGANDFDAAWCEGALLSLEAGIAYAMKGRGGRGRPSSGWDSLTPAERQVAELVGEGLTNREVGHRLFVSPRTVGHHLAHIYQKLGINSRVALIKEFAGREHAASGPI